MFLKYQKLKIIKPYGKGETAIVYYATKYITSQWGAKEIGIITKMIVIDIETEEIIHVEPTNILEIIDGIG